MLQTDLLPGMQKASPVNNNLGDIIGDIGKTISGGSETVTKINTTLDKIIEKKNYIILGGGVLAAFIISGIAYNLTGTYNNVKAMK
jgi:hypothetical protein